MRTRILVWLMMALVAVVAVGCGIQGAPNFAQAEHTPIPPLPPATLPPEPTPEPGAATVAAPVGCRVYPADLIAAWVAAGTPKDEPFTFTDLDGRTCQATFEADVLPLFTEMGVWYENSVPCTACHNANFVGTEANAGMSLETYEDILAGSYRSGPDAQGNDILGGGNWEQSILYDRLVVKKDMPLGRPADAPAKGLEILAGTPVGEEQ
ncbi:MAG: hypothetical protein GXO37_05960 [Chloroflexi bacterium]|nr:hypothetical protein [Chloroflexota bacterium]